MASINIVTDVPGPRSRDLAQRAALSVARPVAPTGGEVFIARGQGAMIEDVDGNQFLDFTGGLGCLVVGHSHPKVVAAVQAITERYLHTDYSVIPYEVYGELALQLAARCGEDRKAAFFNSGAEAVENAVKIARAVTGRPGIVCFEGAFHGRTNLAMALTHREVPYKRGFGPFVPEIYRLPYPGFEGATLESFQEAAWSVFQNNSIAAAIVEPELGEGGYVVPDPGFLSALADTCARSGAFLITDEIQSGYGRAGSFLAADPSGVQPDLITLGKSIAAGLPLSAVVGRARIMDALDPGTIGGTYVGNPVAEAAGLAVLDVIDTEGLVERGTAVGGVLRAFWGAVSDRHPGMITSIRGLGSMLGVEFAEEPTLAALRAAAQRRGILTVTAGREHKVLRHLMPLVITDEQLTEAVEAFSAAADEAAEAAEATAS